MSVKKTSQQVVAVIGMGASGSQVVQHLLHFSAQTGGAYLLRIDCFGRSQSLKVSAKCHDFSHAILVDRLYAKRDITHGVYHDGLVVHQDSYAALREATIIVTCFGEPTDPTISSRANLLFAHHRLVQHVMTHIVKHARADAVLINAVNPVDVMTWSMQQISGWSHRRVFGVAGMHDTARCVQAVTEVTGAPLTALDTKHFFVAGEHGQHMVPLLSQLNLHNRPLLEQISQTNMMDIVERTQQKGFEILRHGGQPPCYGPAKSIALLCQTLLLDEPLLAPCSIWHEAYQVYMSWLTQVQTLHMAPMPLQRPITDDEQQRLNQAAKILVGQYNQISAI